MATIAIRQSAVQAMTAKQRKVARWVMGQVGLIDPAQYTAPNGAVWFVFDDDRITLQDVAYFGKFAQKLANLPADYDPPDALDDATAAQCRAWIRNYLAGVVVWPVSIPEDADPWSTVLAAQNAPAAVKAADGVPSAWTPVVN